MMHLENIDLIGIDTNHPEKTLASLLTSSGQIKFGKILFFTPADKSEFDEDHVRDIEFIKIGKFKEYIDYSSFCLRLAEYCSNDFILINHWDSFIVNPELWTEEFLKYDYIGAPWAKVHARSWNLINHVGNGGFSLRSKKLLQFANKFADTRGDNEDGFLTNGRYREAIAAGIRYAPVDLAYRFSVHHMEDVGGIFEPEKYFGFHGMHNYSAAKKYLEAKGVKVFGDEG